MGSASVDKFEDDAVIAQLIELASADENIEVLWLFGSRARGNANANSDYDLAVAYEDVLPDLAERRLRPELLAMDWKDTVNKDISIVDINDAPTPLAAAIINDNCVLYCRRPFRLHSEEQRIWSKWEAFKKEHERNREPL